MASRFDPLMTNVGCLMDRLRPFVVTLTSCVFFCSCTGVAPEVPREVVVSADAMVKEQTVMKQMLVVQKAAEEYAADHGGKFPTRIDDAFKKYIPRGGVENPFTGKAQLPEMGNVNDLDALSKGEPPSITSGVIQYNAFDDGRVYAIVGGGDKSEAVRDPDHYDRPFILSNIKKYASDAEFLMEDI